MNREKTLRLGGFDEVYSPFYYEDTDLSLRAWQQGWRCLFTVGTFGFHQHSATVKKNHRQEYVDYITARNSKLFSYRFTPPITWCTSGSTSTYTPSRNGYVANNTAPIPMPTA